MYDHIMTQDVEQSWLQLRNGLRAFVSRRVANHAEVEDILQQVFLRMYGRLDSLKDPRRLVSWVFQITRHAIVDHYRAPERQREVPAGLAADIDAAHPRSAALLSSTADDTEAARREIARCLEPFIGRLSVEYREALKLVELQGLTHTAAAKQLGVSVSGMKSRVQRGRRQLKRMLEECCTIQLDVRRGVAGYTPRNGDRCGCSK
jgi:RNA polymerase sigma-70 factor, ECF subfamily